MNSYETSATVEDHGQVHVAGVPFAPGTEVEVTISRKRRLPEEFAVAWRQLLAELRGRPGLKDITDESIREEIDRYLGRPMNVLIDTNVLLSAALRDKLPERVVLHVAGRDEFRWLVTPEILTEYTEVLRRPKFGLDEETLQRWAGLLAMRTVNVASPPTAPDFPRDPKDTPFLAAALVAHADYLITGDKDLLEAKDVLATHIVTVAEFSSQFSIA